MNETGNNHKSIEMGKTKEKTEGSEVITLPEMSVRQNKEEWRKEESPASQG
jgi:hypothetical protein